VSAELLHLRKAKPGNDAVDKLCRAITVEVLTVIGGTHPAPGIVEPVKAGVDAGVRLGLGKQVCAPPEVSCSTTMCIPLPLLSRLELPCLP
jgi:hypothetical protein